MKPKPNEKANQDRLVQLVIFHINNDEFAISIEEVQEIIKVNNITDIPINKNVANPVPKPKMSNSFLV